MVLSQISEHFSVQKDAFLFHRAHKFRIGGIHFSERSIDLDLPKSSSVGFLIFPMGESVRSGVGDGFSGLPFFCGPSKAIALDLFKDIPSSLY